MKFIISTLLLLLNLITDNTIFAQDTINWRPDYRLKWEDFQGLPDTTSEFKAITVADLRGSLSYNSSSFSVTVTCSFDKKKSWTSSNDSIGLLHEQGHFDIAEIFARKLRKACKSYMFNSKTIEDDYNKIFTKIKGERQAYNDKYDKETNFSRNPAKQRYWSKRILSELYRLQAYAR